MLVFYVEKCAEMLQIGLKLQIICSLKKRAGRRFEKNVVTIHSGWECPEENIWL